MQKVGNKKLQPKNSKWSLLSETLCGQRAYLRPCQTQACNNSLSDVVPLADLCATDSEMVVIVEDDADLRDELVEQVKLQGYPVIGLASSNELKNVARDYKTGCVLLDIRLPGQDGLSIQEWLNAIESPLPVIFISGVKDVTTIVSCFKGGAVDFLPKPFDEMVLRRAVDSAVGLSRKRHCAQASRNMVSELLDMLTASELVVAKLIARGYPTKSIAEVLGRSENTIKIHRHRVFSKLSMNSAASVSNIMDHAMKMDQAMKEDS